MVFHAARAPSIVIAAAALCSLLASSGTAQQTVTVTYHDPTRTFAGLTTEIKGLRITGPPENARFRIFDPAGLVVASWQSPVPNWAFGAVCKPQPGGRFLTSLREMTGSKVMLLEVDWSGAVQWAFDPSPLGLRVHHDFQRLANGNTLVLTEGIGKAPWSPSAIVLDDIVLEVNPSGEVVWSWSTLQNAGRLPLSESEWTYLRQLPTTLLFHTNSIQALPPNRWEQDYWQFRAGNVLVSQRNTNLVFLIDKLSGDVVWSYRGAIGQHHPRMIPQDLPGAGNILIYDNGGSAGAPPISRPFSRILELDPISARVVWSYGCGELSEHLCSALPAIRVFSAPFMGSAQRLPNGNTLISDLANGRVFEVTATRDLVWEYVIGAGEQIYRAYRLPFDWRWHRAFTFFW